jgi:uroporphyrinogen decarboxylase
MPAGRYDRLIDSHPRARIARDRVARVVHGGTPDRIPFVDNYWPEFAERYRVERNLSPGASLAERFDHDFALLTPVMGPWPSEAREIERQADGYVVSRDEYGLVIRSHESRQMVPQHLDCRIRDRSDLDRFPFEDPGDPARSAGLETELAEACTRLCPVFKLGGPFSRSWRLRGLERFLGDIAEDEAFAKDLVGRLTDHLIAVGVSAVERLDWPRVQMHIADDFACTAAPLFSPRSYERIFLPNLRRMVDAFHTLGFRISYESEGNVYPMLDLLDESGIDGLAHMEPRAGMTIDRIRERFGDRFFVMGNVCNTRVLPSNDRRVIAREVRRVLASCADGHYLGLSAHSIGTDVSSDTYDYFFGLMDRYGRYPMDLSGLESEL